MDRRSTDQAHNQKNKVVNILEPPTSCSATKLHKTDLDHIINELNKLINHSEPIIHGNECWINPLIENFLQEVGSIAFKVKNLVFITHLMEFLATNAGSVPQYEKHLTKILDLCAHPPLLEKSSEILSCCDDLIQYVNTLGYLVTIMPDHQQIRKVFASLQKMLVRPQPVDISAVKLELCHRAVEKSQLPFMMTEFVATCPQEIFKNVLDIVYVIATTSSLCCHSFLHAGILDCLFTEMAAIFMPNSDPWKASKLTQDETVLITNIIWTLMNSISTSESLPGSSMNFPVPTPNAMRCLRNVFACVTFDKQYSSKTLIIRNDLAAIILAGLIALPSWPLLQSGLAIDIISLVTTSSSYPSTEQNLFFRKTLFAFLCHFSNHNGLIYIMKESNVLENILQLLIHDHNQEIKYGRLTSTYLVPYALRTLSYLVPKMPEEFLELRGSAKLLTIIKGDLRVDEDNRMLLEVIKTMCTIVSSNYSPLLTDLHAAGATTIILRLIEKITVLNQLETIHQTILMLLIMTIETIIVTNVKLIEVHSEQIITVFVKLLDRCRSRGTNEFPKDERLLVSIGSFFWECIVKCPAIIDKFIEAGGTYMILDIIEHESLLVQNVYLGALIDLCDYSCCIPHICTWRGSDKTKGLMSLLARSWRHEELQCGVKRTREGCIEDVELPIMGTGQWHKSFHESKINCDFSPAIAAMIGSVRPKIYSIRKILLNNSELCEKFKDHYKVLLHDLPLEDSITFCIIDQFYRFIQGQVWSEVLVSLRRVGVNPLGTDGEMLLLMRQRYRGCAVYVRERQEKLLNDAKRRELVREREELIKIRDAGLASALAAIQEIDYVRRTTDEQYRLRKKLEQTTQVREALHFPSDADNQYCLRTFDEKWNVTTIFSQDHTTLHHASKL